jgi:hypothetical protein
MRDFIHKKDKSDAECRIHPSPKFHRVKNNPSEKYTVGEEFTQGESFTGDHPSEYQKFTRVAGG